MVPENPFLTPLILPPENVFIENLIPPQAPPSILKNDKKHLLSRQTRTLTPPSPYQHSIQAKTFSRSNISLARHSVQLLLVVQRQGQSEKLLKKFGFIAAHVCPGRKLKSLTFHMTQDVSASLSALIIELKTHSTVCFGFASLTLITSLFAIASMW